MTLLAQLPRLSPYDPGTTGEGSLDPMGMGAIADRIAELLVPALRARMSLPRFATLTALGAVANLPLAELIGNDGSTTADLAFEWLVVSAMVQSDDSEAVKSLPGSQKARRAINSGQRVNAQTYLKGPRVFGFTGVHRPFTVDAQIIGRDELPAAQSEKLTVAWERDAGLNGFFSGPKSSPGGRFREALRTECAAALRNNEAPKYSKHVYPVIQRHMVPNSPGVSERRALRSIITDSLHPLRDELAQLMVSKPPPADVPEHQIAAHLRDRASGPLKSIFHAAIAYEECSTLIDRTFRQLMRHLSAQSGSIGIPSGSSMPILTAAGRALPSLVEAAVDAAAKLETQGVATSSAATGLAADIERATDLFRDKLDSGGMFDALLERHREVQEHKGKRMWLTEVKGGWVTRSLYSNQPLGDDPEIWVHPMRLTTLRRFVEATR